MEHPSLWETPSETKDRILQLHIHTPWEPPSLLLSSEYLANTAVHLNSEWHEQYRGQNCPLIILCEYRGSKSFELTCNRLCDLQKTLKHKATKHAKWHK